MALSNASSYKKHESTRVDHREKLSRGLTEAFLDPKQDHGRQHKIVRARSTIRQRLDEDATRAQTFKEMYEGS